MYHHNSGLSTGESESEDLFKRYCRDIYDFPKKGIIFRDITNLLKNGEVFQKAVDKIAHRFSGAGIDIVCSVEARGFILGSTIAYALGAGFVPIRKKGKLPWTASPARCPHLSMSWRPRIRLSTKAPFLFQNHNWTVFCLG